MNKRVRKLVDGAVHIDAHPDDIERNWKLLRATIRQKLFNGETLTAIERDRLLGLMARKMGIL